VYDKFGIFSVFSEHESGTELTSTKIGASSGHQKKVGGRCPQTRTFVSKPTLTYTLFRPTYTQKFVSEVGLQMHILQTWVFPVYTDVGEVGFPLSVSGIDHWSVKGRSTAMTIQTTSVSVDFLTIFIANVFGSYISGWEPCDFYNSEFICV